ncbi:P-loop NTPase fold protein [Colwellia sp. Bg11-12]|uniref:KAP family P-loop NTPase fold protein n=1 Tax=Colwellia sp. Bg11-12 TaxID=2759817 RepID=UPI0015F46295|nr:P-loop NTPase fold protein [Colwellia sp. Bg11-12]MBA6262300.1 hypothetical protein [Colwellia sp. Bg11-12]
MTKANCKYPEWLTDYTFDNCKLNRKEYGQFLINYIVGEKDGFVLNLNGEWGTGKTQFLRRLYSELVKNKHPCIYIDAWESDFSDIPLSVVSSELTSQLSLLNEDIGGNLEEVGKFLGKALKGTIIGGAGLLTKYFLDDSAAGRELTKTLFEKDPKEFLKSVQSNHLEQVDAIKQIRLNLGHLAEVIEKNYGFALPIVVLVDELDRCRPNYAIEMLEVIKHFFTTKNFVFVVATDTKQLKESIKAIYGSEFDSSTYLKRFFNREARLPTPDIEHYLDIQKFDFSEYQEKVILYPDIRQDTSTTIRNYLDWSAKAYDLSIRDIDQTIDKLKSCLRTALSVYKSSKKVQFVNIFNLISAIVEFDKNIPQFNSRTENKPETNIQFKNNFHIENDCKYSDFYKVNMFTSVIHLYDTSDHYGQSVTYKLCGTDRRLHELKRDNFEGVVQRAVDTNNNIMANMFSNTNAKWWLWEDYNKVVKLAGNIE